jgi:hypothetical protein
VFSLVSLGNKTCVFEILRNNCLIRVSALFGVLRSCRVWSQLDKHVTSAEISSRSKRVRFDHSSTEHRGQALSAPLCILDVLGSNPGAACSSDVVFFIGFLTPSPISSPYPSRIFPPVSVAEKVLESHSSPLGGMKNVSFPLFSLYKKTAAP